jgi:hypothetical protein
MYCEQKTPSFIHPNILLNAHKRDCQLCGKYNTGKHTENVRLSEIEGGSACLQALNPGKGACEHS